MVKSAKELEISQPALSRQLRDFESLVGQNLFKAQGRNKILTPLGQEIYNNVAKKWIDYSSLVQESLESFAAGPKNEVKIYGPSDFVSRLALHLKTDFALDLIPAESEEVEAYLESGDISLGIGRRMNENSNLVSKFLFQHDFHLVYPKAWKIEDSSFGIKMIRKLANYPRVSFRRDMVNKNLIELMDKVEVINHRIIPNWFTILNLVKSAKGWALAPLDVLESYGEVGREITTVKVPHEIIQPVKYYLMYRKDLSRISWFRQLVQEVLENGG